MEAAYESSAGELDGIGDGVAVFLKEELMSCVAEGKEINARSMRVKPNIRGKRWRLLVIMVREVKRGRR